ncbi:MAG: DUF3631 domain-containing protein [Planctomycetes bacterium]|nr:DUF3631 domain-containing protein [Planctomycetota bacterium]
MTERSIFVLSAWVAAAWLSHLWKEFPHLAITSPQKRCGKSPVLQSLNWIVPKSRNVLSIEPDAIYRVIELEKPTLLIHELKIVARGGSDASRAIREILTAGVAKGDTMTRLVGEHRDELRRCPVYCPKIIATKGEPDGDLADICLPIPMSRKPKSVVGRLRAGGSTADLYDRFEKWTKENGKAIAKIYDHLEPFAMEDECMANLLRPLQAVLTAAGGGRMLEILREYADSLDNREEGELGVRLLAACREIFDAKGDRFLPTKVLITELRARTDEPWQHHSHGRGITPESLGLLLRPFGVLPERNSSQTRGYFAYDFQQAWDRYLPSFFKK